MGLQDIYIATRLPDADFFTANCFFAVRVSFERPTFTSVAAMNAAAVKRTQDTLGKVIKKPPLTEKLLNKPPFRYLHDILSEVRLKW